jgi:DNA invertase Pin-like site-specific DNA recombinase
MPPIRPNLVLDIYARVSRLSDERQRSTDGQVADCTARILEAGATLGETFVEAGRSAWNPRVKRKRWHELMERLESGASGGVVVFDLARFSRQPIEGERLIAAADRGVIVWDSDGEYDLTSASGKKAFRDQMTAAAYESDRTSTRTRRGKRLKAMRGESNHSSRPFGFEPDGITPREPEASELRTLIARLLAGESQDAMVVDLNTRGVLTSYGNPWNRISLKQVLTRPRNAGLAEYDGEIVGKLTDKPVIDPADFDRVRALYASRRRGRPESDAYQCSGIITCALCGQKLTGRPQRHRRPYDDGSVRRQYWCQPRAHDGGCGWVAIDHLPADEAVRELVLAILADPRHAAAVEASARETASKRQELEEQIAELDQTATELAARLGSGAMTLARYDAAAGPLEQRLAGLRTQLAALGAVPAGVVTDEMRAVSRAQWDQRWKGATVAQRRAMIRQALRGRRLVVDRADSSLPRVFDPARIRIVD